MKLSVIFIHYSTDELKTMIALNSLITLKKTLDTSAELIIVNNGKRDGHFKYLCDKYIETSLNCVGHAKNVGFQESVGDYLCFMGNDIFVERGWWQECVKLLERYGELKFISSPLYSQKPYKIGTAGMLEGHPLNYRNGFPWIMKRESFAEIGLFDERPDDFKEHKMSFVGTLYCNRLKKKGFKIILTKPNLVYHLGMPKYPYEF